MKSKSFTPMYFFLSTKEDERGLFSPFWPLADNSQDDLKIKRVYCVTNPRKNVIRGFHFHKKEWKIFTIVKGHAKFVAVDPANSENKWTMFSSERLPTAVLIPPGYANGWMSLVDDTILVCASTATFDESIHDDKRFDPMNWGDVWTIKNR